MVHRIQQVINLIVAVCLLGSTVWIAPAGAGMIGTDKVATESQSNNDRDRLKTLVARPEIAKQLETLGVPPDKAQERINAMTDSEVRTLAGRIFSTIGRTIALQPAFVNGYCAASSDVIDVSSARARARSAPGLSRPTANRYRESRLFVAASGVSGIHTFSV